MEHVSERSGRAEKDGKHGWKPFWKCVGSRHVIPNEDGNAIGAQGEKVQRHFFARSTGKLGGDSLFQLTVPVLQSFDGIREIMNQLDECLQRSDGRVSGAR